MGDFEAGGVLFLTRIFHESAYGGPQGVGPEPYLNGASPGELVLSLSKEHPRTHGRTAILFALATLRSVPHRKRHLRQAGSRFRGRSR
jgi:hypothetical protein